MTEIVMDKTNAGQTSQILAALETQAAAMPAHKTQVVMETLEYLSEMAVDDLAAQFQILWDTGTNPGALTLGASVPRSAILKAELKQPRISKARAFMLEKMLQGQEAAEQAWAMDREEQGATNQQETDSLVPTLNNLPVTQRAELEQVVFLEALMSEFHKKWRTNPLFRGAVNEIVQAHPKTMMAMVQDQDDPARVNLAPLIIRLILTEGAINHQQQTQEVALKMVRLRNRESADRERLAAQSREIESEVVEALGQTIGSALHSSTPLTALLRINPLLDELNLKSAGLPSD
jgi:hypothetical protein